MLVKLNVVVAAAAALVAGTAFAADELIVKIGHVGPMSGPQAHYGKDNESGVRFALDELNAKGVMIGGKKAKFVLVPEDDAADPKQGTAAAQKLCDAKVNGVIGHLNSGTTIPAAKIYNDCGIPHITGAATNPKLTQFGYKTTFRLVANDNALGAGLANYAADKLKAKRVVVIDDRSAYGQGIADVFKKTAKARGLQIVDEQFTTDKATDFTAILTTVKAKNPEVIFYGGMDPQGGPMLRQMEQLGLTNVKFLGGDGICTTKLADLSGNSKLLSNVICAEGGSSLQKMPGGVEWKKRYDAKYPGVFQIYGPFKYDATMVMVQAMVKAGSADPKVYGPKLFETKYDGVTAHIEFDEHGDLKNPAMTLYTYKDGKRTEID